MGTIGIYVFVPILISTDAVVSAPPPNIANTISFVMGRYLSNRNELGVFWNGRFSQHADRKDSFSKKSIALKCYNKKGPPPKFEGLLTNSNDNAIMLSCLSLPKGPRVFYP